MKLIRRLGTKPSKTGKSISSWGLFLCSYCKQEVECQLTVGRENKSCGCSSWKLISAGVTKHGKSKSSLYSVWHGMKTRCYNKNVLNHKHYGARGIIVCKEWINNFELFQNWALENGYKKGLQIDRIDNNGNYNPSNCRFVSQKENMRNNRATKLTHNEINHIRTLHEAKNYYQYELAEMFNICEAQISNIINYKSWI
uniref:Uncharacterized protein n=1 Tax=viral metagenome TaxID=1070528 RepID=A0A6M3J1L0_9ZZZZ